MEKLAIGMTVIAFLFAAYLVIDNTWDMIKKSINDKVLYTRQAVQAWRVKIFSRINRPIVFFRNAYREVLCYLYNTL
jgi:hypothetical protein